MYFALAILLLFIPLLLYDLHLPANKKVGFHFPGNANEAILHIYTDHAI